MQSLSRLLIHHHSTLLRKDRDSICMSLYRHRIYIWCLSTILLDCQSSFQSVYLSSQLSYLVQQTYLLAGILLQPLSHHLFLLILLPPHLGILQHSANNCIAYLWYLRFHFHTHVHHYCFSLVIVVFAEVCWTRHANRKHVYPFYRIFFFIIPAFLWVKVQAYAWSSGF